MKTTLRYPLWFEISTELELTDEVREAMKLRMRETVKEVSPFYPIKDEEMTFEEEVHTTPTV